MQELGLDEAAAWWTVSTVKILTAHSDWFRTRAPKAARAYQVLTRWLSDAQVQQFLQVNRYRGVLWFNHEAFQQLTTWMLTVAAVQIAADETLDPADVATQIADAYDLIRTLQQAEAGSGYQVEKLIDAIQK
jgi:hypothetical protein